MERSGLTFLSIVNKQKQSFNTFQKILIFCKKNNIDLQLFISPVHAKKLQLFYQIGLWDNFEYWKKEMLFIIKKNTPQYSLWDFTGYNEITTESFPSIGDTKTQMKWYWESSHYKKETGDLILNKMLNDQAQSDITNTFNFGVQLTSSNIDSHLKKIRIERDLYGENHPEIINELDQLIIKTAPRRNKLINQYPELTPLNYFKKLSLPLLNPNLSNE